MARCRAGDLRSNATQNQTSESQMREWGGAVLKAALKLALSLFTVVTKVLLNKTQRQRRHDQLNKKGV